MLLLCLALTIALAGCGDKEAVKDRKSGETTITSDQAIEEDTKDYATKQESDLDLKNKQTDKKDAGKLAEEEKNPSTKAVAKASEPGAKKGQGTALAKTDHGKNEVTIAVEGSGVANPIKLTLSELKDMKDGYFAGDFFSLNSWGTKEYFYFEGVKLKNILDAAKLKATATSITFVAEDGYEQTLTKDAALKEDYIDEQDDTKKYPVIIAWHENKQDYKQADGAPFRMVIGQKAAGDVNKPQWVSNITKIVVE